MPGTCDGKVAFVTGGASGIGRATALTFAREGDKLIIADVHEDGGRQTVHMITENGGDAIFVQVEVTSATAVEAMICRAVNTYGRLDCAHNNAGILGTPFIPLTDYTEDQWDQIMTVNLKGIWLCMKYEIPQMRVSRRFSRLTWLPLAASHPECVFHRRTPVGPEKIEVARRGEWTVCTFSSIAAKACR